MKKNITCYAFFTQDEVMKDAINISFPGLPGCLSCAFSVEQAIKYAHEALSLYLHGMDISNLPKMLNLSDLPKCGSNTTVYAITVTMYVKNGKLIGKDIVAY